MSSMLGRRLGRYEIHAELGRGGMARVYQALDTMLQRRVALKILAAQLSLDDEFVRRFEREAATAANLRHPAIVTIYDVGEHDGLYYIAMELVQGRTLHAILEEHQALGLGYAISLLEPVARALDFAHDQGAVHRDIKPHNILIDQDGRVLLTDFGIAQTPDSDGERLTRTGVFMGTPEYISPEQAEARRVDGRSDLYSLGVVAYELITGRVPFVGSTPQLIVAHAQQPPPPPRSLVPDLPFELDEVLLRALAKRPERRYPTGMALIEALREVAARTGTPLPTREHIAGFALPAGQAPTPSIPQPLPSLPPRPRSQPLPPPAKSVGLVTAREPSLNAAGSQPPFDQATVLNPGANAVPPRPPPVRGADQATARDPAANATPSRPRPQPSSRQTPPTNSVRPVIRPTPPNQDRLSQWPQIMIGVVLVMVTLGLITLATRSLAGPIWPPPAPSLVPPLAATATPSPSPLPPTEAPGLVGSALPVATLTPEPSVTPLPMVTPTLLLPTATIPRPTSSPTRPPVASAVPTSTATLAPSFTPAPTEIPTPTATAEPTATAAPTATVTPTVTLAPTITPTDTPPLLEDTPIPLPPELSPYP